MPIDWDSFPNYWRFEPNACVTLEPPNGRNAPMLYFDSATKCITLAPPVDREHFPQFMSFLSQLVNAANELAMMCHPYGAWGRQVFADVIGNPDGDADAGMPGTSGSGSDHGK